MPLHDFRCEDGHTTEQLVGQGVDWVICEICECLATKVFLKAPAGYVSMDICYDSPIDGRPITNKHARIEDLARNECVEYEPTQRVHNAKRRVAEDAMLDASIEHTLNKEIAAMPARKKEKLVAEVQNGAGLEVVRN